MPKRKANAQAATKSRPLTKATVKKPLLKKPSSSGESLPTRERMLMRAAELFAEHGYAHARLEDIAKVTGVTKGSLFWHFKNKRQIYAESVKLAMEKAYEHPQFPVDAADPGKRLRQYLEWIAHAMSSSRVTRRLVLHMIIDQDTEILQELMKGPLGESYAALTQILKELKPRHNKTALSFFIYAIFTVNDELLELASVWDPKSKKVIGGRKTIQFVEMLVKS